jgi:prepilin-type N-terminal cleavage/methylation domain-containing protein/prepilin-type processing-associated H-X9-DG protein
MVRRRPGFTIVELLVVIAIIGMLTAILLPAVNIAREAARRNNCLTNLRSMAQATAMFHTQFNRYPGYNEQLKSGSKWFPWTVSLLPFLEQNVVYEPYHQWVRQDKSSSVQPPPALTPHISITVCPDDNSQKLNGPGTSYVANAGRSDRELRGDGVFMNYANGGYYTSSDLIRDGTTQTMLLTENLQATSWALISVKSNGSMPTEQPNSIFVWHNTIPDVSDPNQALMLINGGPDNVPVPLTLATARPSSGHPSGVNVAFCDGHGLFLDQDIDYAVYVQLMTSDSKQARKGGTIPALGNYVLQDNDYN